MIKAMVPGKETIEDCTAICYYIEKDYPSYLFINIRKPSKLNFVPCIDESNVKCTRVLISEL